jgi:thiol-disulfide isomerase/thioredoxin
MARQPVLIGAALLVLAAVVTVGVVQATHRDDSTGTVSAVTPAEARAALSGSPTVLAALHGQAGELLGGGEPALHARLAALRGYPVVVNKWASWCQPCRSEFGVFSRVSAQLGRRVAFVGIDSNDHGDATGFLAAHPVSYPSYADRDGSTGNDITLSSFFPVTVFYDRDGRQSFIHQGAFTSVAQLQADIQRYAPPAA